MKQSQFTECQIISALKEYEQGVKVADIARKLGVSEKTFYRWKSKYGGMDIKELKRIKELEKENSELKKMYAEMALVNNALKALAPDDKREAISYLISSHKISQRKACKLLDLPKSTYLYKKKPKQDDRYIDLLNDLVQKHVSIGFWQCYYRIRRTGYIINHKKLYRIYTEMKLNLRRKSKKRLPARVKRELFQPAAMNEVWSIDFMSDSLWNGRKIRLLNVIDDYNREILWIETDTSLLTHRVIRTLEALKESRGLPKMIRVDNGPEFISGKLSL